MFCKLLVTHGNYFLSRHKNISGIFSLITMTKDSTIHIITQREAKQDKSDKTTCAWMSAGKLSVYFVGPRRVARMVKTGESPFIMIHQLGMARKQKVPAIIIIIISSIFIIIVIIMIHQLGIALRKKVPAIIIIISPPSS